MTIRLADYCFRLLAERGVDTVFLLTGGGAMYLDDALAKSSVIKSICNQHEQACAMAAEGYARVTGKVGVVCVTTGPGGINAMNGVFGAWTDSIPMLVISGQVKRETCLSINNIAGLRQLGDQEADIITMIKSITKYAYQVTDPETIRYHLEKALFLAENGRPGPCWLDIPIDVQSSMIDENMLPGYDCVEDALKFDEDEIIEKANEVIDRIKSAKRPVILAGTGIRCANAVEIFSKVIHKLGIPVTTGWTHDTISSDDPLFCGRAGTIGDRAGNFTVQNSDLLLVLGSRLNIRQVSYNWKSFARAAYKIQVDIDPAEFRKPTVRIDLPILSDLQYFLEVLDKRLDEIHFDSKQHENWSAWCKERFINYPVLQPRMKKFNGKINPYYFLDTLFKKIKKDDVVVTANGAACVMSFQVAHLSMGQRLFSNSGSASMGYELPAAIGAAVGRGGKRVICLAGDGSIQLNIQELATIVGYRLPIKIFVLNNGGYLSIHLTQKNNFGRFIGESSSSGVFIPDYTKVASAYGLSTMRIVGEDFSEEIDRVLASDDSCLVEVILDPEQGFEPKLSSKQLPDGRMVSPALEDLFPFLPREEFLKNMLIEPEEF